MTIICRQLRCAGRLWAGRVTIRRKGRLPASSFDALEAILARVADRRLFPNLKQVVVAGHSGGAQVVHAIAGKGKTALTKENIAVRYVANPSSYDFSADRPEPVAASCPGYTIGHTAWTRALPSSRARRRQNWSDAMSRAR
jgi:hypothetical protein